MEKLIGLVKDWLASNVDLLADVAVAYAENDSRAGNEEVGFDQGRE
jgi:hypothetical protein